MGFGHVLIKVETEPSGEICLTFMHDSDIHQTLFLHLKLCTYLQHFRVYFGEDKDELVSKPSFNWLREK